MPLKYVLKRHRTHPLSQTRTPFERPQTHPRLGPQTRHCTCPRIIPHPLVRSASMRVRFASSVGPLFAAAAVAITHVVLWLSWVLHGPIVGCA
jgi:hypothetical protein